MDSQSNVLGTTHSSPDQAGKRRRNWRRERIFSVSKTCSGCGETFKPWIKYDEVGKISSTMSEKIWERQKFCSVRCAKRFSPTALDAQARQKISKRLKEIKHRPIRRGGNGRLLPLPQLALLHALGAGWVAEHPIKTNAGHRNGVYPNAYKVDIANPEMMLAIELDGGSHSSLERKAQDTKKVECLVRLGWRVLRISNEEALRLYSTFKSVGTLLTSLGV
jgi:hypothetical protein